jgi:tetratricopeptide (TPR) repeat protein
MSKTAAVIIILIAILSAPTYAASLRPSDYEMGAILKTVGYVFADSFERAREVTNAFNDTFPGQPLYHLLIASVAHSQMMDGENFSNEKEFMTNVEYCLDALERWVEQNPNDPWGHFFMGSALGYKSIWQGQKGSWLKSLLSGLKAKGKFADALRLDPHLYDCYTGIGAYHYWSSVKLRKIFPFLSDDRQKGLGELKLAMDSSHISHEAAAIGYGWALLNERKYSDALKVAWALNDSTGGARNALWLLGGIYWGKGDLKNAAENYGKLIKSLERAGEQNYYNLIYCRYRRGYCLYSMKKYKEAEQEFNAILSYKPSKEIRNRHNKTYQRANEYLEKIRTELAQGK